MQTMSCHETFFSYICQSINDKLIMSDVDNLIREFAFLYIVQL